MAEDAPEYSSFVYTFNNPIKYSDPDGRWPIETIWDVANVIYDVGKIAYGAATGNPAMVASGTADLGADVAATLIPYVPAGATKVIKGGVALAKTTDKVKDTKNIVSKADDALDMSRKGSFNDAKRDLGIPKSQHPDKINGKQYEKKAMTDRNGNTILGKDGKPITTREYTFSKTDGSKSIIQDHSAGHKQFDGKAAKPHFNVRPPENTRTGKVPGTKDHYPIKEN